MDRQAPLWVYRALRAVFRHGLRIFFRHLEVSGDENVPETGPLLLAANHPNTLIDALLVATLVRRRVRFVAKAPVLAMPVLGPLMRVLGAVPVHRRLDGPVGDDAVRANQAVLGACERVVAEGGAVLIFPEGISSQEERRLLPLKTGLARIALGAERQAPGQVVVVPVALVYEDPGTFRTTARVRYGEPIRVAPFAAAAAADDDFGPARALTEAVREALELDVVHLDDAANEALFRDLDLLYGDTLASEAGGRLAATKALARAVNAFSREEPERVVRIRGDLSRYRAALAAAGVTDRVVRQKAIPRPSLGQDLLFWLGAPVAAWGWVNHLLFYQVPRMVIRLWGTSREFAATVKLLSGFVALLTCYALQTGWVYGWAGALGAPQPAAVAAAYLGSLPVSGLMALLWVEGLAWRHQARRAAAVRRGLDPGRLAALEAQRAEVIRALDQARVAWLSRQLAS